MYCILHFVGLSQLKMINETNRIDMTAERARTRQKAFGLFFWVENAIM